MKKYLNDAEKYLIEIEDKIFWDHFYNLDIKLNYWKSGKICTFRDNSVIIEIADTKSLLKPTRIAFPTFKKIIEYTNEHTSQDRLYEFSKRLYLLQCRHDSDLGTYYKEYLVPINI